MPQENVYTEKRFRLFVVGIIFAPKVGIKIEKRFVKMAKNSFYNTLFFNNLQHIYNILIYLLFQL